MSVISPLTSGKTDSTTGSHNNDWPERLIIVAFQTACLALILLNATFIGELLYQIKIEGPVSIVSYLFFLLIAILNIFEIMNNWVSIIKFFKCYNLSLFLIDVATLGLFYWQIQSLSKSLDPSCPTVPHEYLIFSFGNTALLYWIMILISYIIWNFIVLAKLKHNMNIKESISDIDHAVLEIKGSIAIRISQVIFTICILAYTDPIPFAAPYIAVFIIYTVHHNSTLNIFDILIKARSNET